MRKNILFFVVALIISCSASAYTVTVTNTLDSGNGSLRAAIDSVNAHSGQTCVINFNIPATDPGYDAGSGVWIINILNNYAPLTAGNTTIDGTSQTTSQGDSNAFGPEIMLLGNGTTSANGLIIASMTNTVKSLIVSGFTYGISCYGAAAIGDVIMDCYIGTNAAGSAAIPNNEGIAIGNGSGTNIIRACLVSGNTDCGIVITDSDHNAVINCKVGTDRSGIAAIPNNFGIAINNSTLSIVGGNKSKRNLISGNTTAGVAINGTASCCNQVAGNFIGTDITGLLRLPNDNGILITGANSNSIGGNTADTRNIISGNTTGGITMNGTGTRLNRITGNYIGTDSTGLQICHNQGGVILKSNSDNNLIGDSLPGMGNVLSGNSEIGLYLESSDSNVIMNNFIGPDATGTGPLMLNDSMFQANGMEFNTVSKHNVLGGMSPQARNIVSGNRVYGVIYYGAAAYNNVIGNYIGTDASGNIAMKNATGICVDGATNHSIIANNVLSGNVSYGIFIVTTGTYYNKLSGNMIGTNAAGTDTVPNDIGVLLGGGTKYNMIGGYAASDRNIISGNHYEGIEVADQHTSHNQIRGNYIGTDITGIAALPNKRGIGLASNPSSNTIAQNVISGNNSFGIILYNNADSNRILSNLIGMAANGTSLLGNGSSGIVIADACSNNLIGMTDSANTIAANDSGAIVVVGNSAVNNRISSNSIFGNMYMGIELFPPGPNGNDPGDGDSGPNGMMNYPVIATAHFNPNLNKTWVTGTIDTPDPELATLEFFISDNSFIGYGQGKTYLGSANPGSDGHFSALVDATQSGQKITATATDANGNTSEFSANVSVVTGIEQAVENRGGNIQLFPNPVSEHATLSLFLDQQSAVKIAMHTPDGRLVLSRDAGLFNPGLNTYTFTLDGISYGIYFLNITINDDMKKAMKIIVE